MGRCRASNSDGLHLSARPAVGQHQAHEPLLPCLAVRRALRVALPRQAVGGQLHLLLANEVCEAAGPAERHVADLPPLKVGLLAPIREREGVLGVQAHLLPFLQRHGCDGLREGRRPLAGGRREDGVGRDDREGKVRPKYVAVGQLLELQVVGVGHSSRRAQEAHYAEDPVCSHPQGWAQRSGLGQLYAKEDIVTWLYQEDALQAELKSTHLVLEMLVVRPTRLFRIRTIEQQHLPPKPRALEGYSLQSIDLERHTLLLLAISPLRAQADGKALAPVGHGAACAGMQLAAARQMPRCWRLHGL
mmetsp:Transcript_94739/g.277124  ORF Transcript_94739/g.277124 Transcript_94739/m.277124 type:complete len:303 (+) Transcript_94739:301-1209(+)